MHCTDACGGAGARLAFIGAMLVAGAGCGSGAEASATFSTGSGAVITGAGGAGGGSDHGGGIASSAAAGGTAGSSVADSGAGDATDSGPPQIPLGVPITAPDGKWTDVPFPQGYCRDGTPAHLMVHLNSSSKKFAIYLEGGGACFNDASCTFGDLDLPSYVLGQGIFNFSRADNPIGDWNIFYVPYCTGDAQVGANPAGVPGPLTGPQNFAGYENLQLYLSRILATVPDATDELLVGSSAGGFGAGLNAGLVARNAPASVQKFTMIDDSGPPMSSQYIPPCLQDMWRKVWNFDASFLKECGAACPTANDYVFDWMQYLLETYAKGPFAPKFMGGLVSWTGDSVIRTFYGFGANDCTTTVPIQVGSAQFEAGLLGFRDKVQAQTSAFGTYFAAGTSHTFLIQDSSGLFQGTGLLGGLYDTQVGGVKLVDWINDLLAHKQAAHVGP